MFLSEGFEGSRGTWGSPFSIRGESLEALILNPKRHALTAQVHGPDSSKARTQDPRQCQEVTLVNLCASGNMLGTSVGLCLGIAGCRLNPLSARSFISPGRWRLHHSACASKFQTLRV